MAREAGRCGVRFAAGRRYGSASRHVVDAAGPAPGRHPQAEPDAGQERVPGDAVRERGAPVAHDQHQRRGRERYAREPGPGASSEGEGGGEGGSHSPHDLFSLINNIKTVTTS